MLYILYYDFYIIVSILYVLYSSRYYNLTYFLYYMLLNTHSLLYILFSICYVLYSVSYDLWCLSRTSGDPVSNPLEYQSNICLHFYAVSVNQNHRLLVLLLIPLLITRVILPIPFYLSLFPIFVVCNVGSFVLNLS